MPQDTVQFGHALIDDFQHSIDIEHLNRETSKGHSFYCPNCRQIMYPTFGSKYIHHFRHKGQKCQFDNYLHELAKCVFKEEFERCLKDNKPFLLELHTHTKCNRDCLVKTKKECNKYDRVTVDLAQLYSTINLEKRIVLDDHYRRPDILLKSDNGQLQLWIEIWVTHETELKKRDDGPIVEIKISSEKDLGQFRNHHIIQSEENEFAVRAFNVDYKEDKVAVQAQKFDCLSCHDYAAQPSIPKEIPIHSNTAYNHRTHSSQKAAPWVGRTMTRPAQPTMQESVKPSPESTEWVDLGLPSGTLWAKADAESGISFIDAKRKYGDNVPSVIQAEELQKCCSREWYPETKTIVIKGSNGNSISFYCPFEDTPFWLNSYDPYIGSNKYGSSWGRYSYESERFGNCYHLGKDKRFNINDKEEHSLIGLHLIKKQ